MATRTVFEDNDNNEMTCYLNDKGMLFMQIQQTDDDDPIGSGYITMNKDDVQELIKILTAIEKQMD